MVIIPKVIFNQPVEYALVEGVITGDLASSIDRDFKTKFEQSLPYLTLDSRPLLSDVTVYALKLPSGVTVYVPELWIDSNRITEHGTDSFNVTIANCTAEDRKLIVSLIQGVGKTITEQKVVS